MSGKRIDRFGVLDLARDAVTRRAAAYGDPTPHFQRAARIWSVLLGIEVVPHQVPLCLEALKMVRRMEAPTHLDSAVDSAGFAAIAHEVAVRTMPAAEPPPPPPPLDPYPPDRPLGEPR